MTNRVDTKWLGWQPDVPDFRDKYLAEAPVEAAVESDLTKIFPLPCYNQGELGSCTSQATEFATRFARFKRGLPDFPGSRLYVYFNSRKIEGSESSDSGAQIRDAIKATVDNGVCHEMIWPYDVIKYAIQPPDAAYKEGARNQSILYRRVPQTPEAIRGVLTSGWPVVFGATLYRSFDSEDVARIGVVPMPFASEPTIGGHAQTICGHSDARQAYLVRNSWGVWGLPDKPGYSWMPYDYIHNADLCADFWVITGVEDSLEPSASTPVKSHGFWGWLTGLFGK